jgi:hypothetical protein
MSRYTLMQGVDYGEWDELASFASLVEAVAAAKAAVPDAKRTVHGADFTIYDGDKPVAIVNAIGTFYRHEEADEV